MINYKHIFSDPYTFGGEPVIKGTRISVELILELISSGTSIEDIVKTYPHLSKESVSEAVKYVPRQN